MFSILLTEFRFTFEKYLTTFVIYRLNWRCPSNESEIIDFSIVEPSFYTDDLVLRWCCVACHSMYPKFYNLTPLLIVIMERLFSEDDWNSVPSVWPEVGLRVAVDWRTEPVSQLNLDFVIIVTIEFDGFQLDLVSCCCFKMLHFSEGNGIREEKLLS